MRTPVALILLVLSPLVVACSSSSTEEAKDAATKPDTSAPHDAGKPDAHDSGTSTQDTGAPVEACTPPPDAGPQPVFTLEAGVTWTDLYRDYFGNNTAAHTAGCANGCFCHGSTDGEGYSASGFLCPSGDKAGCYKSFVSQGPNGTDFVMPDGGFDADIIGGVLCLVNDAGQTVGDGLMPFGCVYNFTPADVARISAWLQAGYPDN